MRPQGGRSKSENSSLCGQLAGARSIWKSSMVLAVATLPDSSLDALGFGGGRFPGAGTK